MNNLSLILTVLAGSEFALLIFMLIIMKIYHRKKQ